MLKFAIKALLCAAVVSCAAASAATQEAPILKYLHPQATPKENAYLNNITTQTQVPISVYKKYDQMINGVLARSKKPGVLSPGMRGFIDAERGRAAGQIDVEKREALSQLGLPDQGTGDLYILVSSSMPRHMLREYAAEAIYTGAVLDFRGVLADRKYPLSWFLKHEIMPLLSLNKNARPTVTIDPRPFEIWNVQSVPTIVYTKVPNLRLCESQVVHQVRALNWQNQWENVPYHSCAPMNPKDYWEMQGDVTLSYALRKFSEDGATGIKPLLKALKDGKFPKSETVSGLSRTLYEKLQTPGGQDEILDALKTDGWYAQDARAFNLKNPGDFARAGAGTVRKALNEQRTGKPADSGN